jgi:two-component system sensor histidine kinase AgrC
MLIELMLINTIFAAVSAGMIYYFLNINFKVKVSTTRLALFLTCFGVLNGVISSLWVKIFPNPGLQFIKSIILFSISTIIIKYMLKIEWPKSILSFCVVMLGLALGNNLIPVLFKVTVADVMSSISSYTIVNISINLVAFFLVFAISLIQLFNNSKSLKPGAFLLGTAFVIAAINFGVQYIAHFDPIPFIASLLSSIVYFIASILYLIIYQKSEMKLEENKQQAFYNESLSKALQDLRHFKHDQANHLSVINAMLHMKKYNEAALYLNEIVSSTQALTNTAVFNIKNAGLFGIISSKMDKAAKTGVSFDLQVIGVVDSITSIKISDLCEIIGIHLDNAIEAAQASDQKDVEMLVMSTDSSIEITLKNSCSNVPVLNKIKLDGYSTKGEDRGHGLFIVDKLLHNYPDVLNTLKFDNENMQFIQILSIKKGR